MFIMCQWHLSFNPYNLYAKYIYFTFSDKDTESSKKLTDQPKIT